MSRNADDPDESDLSSDLSEDLATRLAELDADELRAVRSYVESLSSPAPTPVELITERSGERILDVTECEGYTEVVKEQPCAKGCSDCPHGPYLYRVRVRPPVDGDSEPTLKWDFIGSVVD